MKIKESILGTLVLIIIGWLFWLNFDQTKSRVIRHKNGHQYNRTFEGTGNFNYQHLEGCDHPSHKLK